jgi:hypothetical protein
MANELGKCVCCEKPGKFSIVLAIGPQGKKDVQIPRYYIPNQSVRQVEDEGLPPVTNEVPFCGKCMRAVEDSLRATILNLQSLLQNVWY